MQPCNLDTGPGLLLGLMHLSRRTPEARVAIFPSDHLIGNDAALLSSVDPEDLQCILFLDHEL